MQGFVNDRPSGAAGLNRESRESRKGLIGSGPAAVTGDKSRHRHW